MSNLSSTINGGFSHYFQNFARTVRSLSEPLPEQEFWSNPYPYGTSIGNLVLHLTGNLSAYIGAELAGTDYVRNRELEFSGAAWPTKVDALQALETAIQVVIETLERQSDEDWARPYQAVGVDDVQDRFNIFLRCAVHFHHHIGQMMYTADEHRKNRVVTP